MKATIISISLFLFANIILAQSNKENPRKDFLQAKKYYEYTKYDSAIMLYKQASIKFEKDKNKEEYFNCMIGIGQCYCKKNEFTKALDYFIDLQLQSEKQFGKNTEFPATCIYYQGYANLYLYKLDNAGKLISDALQLREKLYGKNNADVAQAYNLYGQYFLYKSQYDKSLENFEQAILIRKSLYGENHKDIAQSLNNISALYYQKGRLDTAIFLAEKSLKMKENVLEPNHPDFIQSYNSLAVYLNEKFEYNKALEMHLKNLTLSQKYYGDENPITATVYYNIGITYYKLNDYKKATYNLDKSAQIRKLRIKNDNPDLAAVHLAKGDVYDKTYEFDKAISEKQKAVKIYNSVYGENHYSTAISHNGLGVSLMNNGDFESALENIQKAFNIFNTLYSETNDNSAMCLVNIGNVYLNLGQNETSIKYYLRAISIYRQLYGDFFNDLAAVYSNIGQAYNELSEYQKALEFFDKSRYIYQKLFGNNSEPLAILYKNLGNSYEFMGKPDEAIKFYQQALEISLKTNGENHLTTADFYINIGKVFYAKGNFAQAKTNYEKAFEIQRSILPRKHYLLAYSLIDKGLSNFKLSDYTAALMDYNYSLECNLNDYTPAGINLRRIPEIKNYQDIIAILTALKGKAITFATMYNEDKKFNRQNKENLEDALEHLKACDKTIDIIRISALDEKDKLAFSANSTAVYDFGINLCNLLYLETKEQKYQELAFYYSEKLKAVTLFEALTGSEAKEFGNVPDSIILHEKNLDKKLANLRKQIAENVDYGLSDTLFKLENEKKSLIKHCETKYPKYFELKYASQIANAKTIQAVLDNNTALISYYQTDSLVYQIVLTNATIEINLADKWPNFDEDLEMMRSTIINGNIKANTEKYKELSSKFYEVLFPEKLDKQLTKLIIIPAGNLANIPFEVLLTSKPAANQKFKDLPYLINRYTISYAYSANLYFLTSIKQKQKQIEITQMNDWLAFAPVFSDETTSGISIRSRSLLEQIKLNFDTLQTRATLLNGNYVSPLPGTELEVKSIFDEFNMQNKKAVVRINQSANEQFVKSTELTKYKYIHFATHGFVDSENPELSGILLAQDTSGGNDGILFSGEIYNLELNADLVILSACETGLGKVQSGEGIIGLTRALLYAGSKNIIVSLWQVADEATSKLMIDFYAEMLKTNNQTTFADYLRTAKLKMIKDGKFAHPFFWSPFVLIGY